jgi:hypothetical protein
MVHEASGKTLADSTFYVDGSPRPFLRLRARHVGALRVIDDPAAGSCHVTHGLYSGLQNSVIRAACFDDYRFEAHSRNEAEDQLFVIHALIQNRRLAYIDNIHVIYVVHDGNSSAVGADLHRQRRVVQGMIEGFERLAAENDLPASLRHAVQRRLSRDWFWLLGYSTLLPLGERAEALRAMRRGLVHWPWDWRCWKTYALSRLRGDRGVSRY